MLSSRPQLSVVIPAFNETRRLATTMDHVLAYFAHRGPEGEVIVVDDGSTDGTAALVERYAQDHPAVRLLRNPTNRGKGYSVRRGMLEARGDVALFSDADESAPIAEAGKLLDALDTQGADVAIGSRELPGSELARPQPWHRRLLGGLFRQLVRVLAVGGIRDTQCGFKAFRRQAAQAIFQRQALDGFAFDVEVLVIARSLGYAVVEVPVRWLDSPHTSVRVARHGLGMLYDLVRIRLRALRGAYR